MNKRKIEEKNCMKKIESITNVGYLNVAETNLKLSQRSHE